MSNQKINPDSIALALLQGHLEVTVPSIITDIQNLGGVTPEMIRELQQQQFANLETATEDTDLQFGGKSAGKAATRLSKTLAVLSFCPGGVTAFGCHFEADITKRNEEKR